MTLTTGALPLYGYYNKYDSRSRKMLITVILIVIDSKNRLTVLRMFTSLNKKETTKMVSSTLGNTPVTI